MGKNFKNFRSGANLGSRDSAPSDAKDGDIYYDNSLGAHRYRQNGAWVVPVTSAPINSIGWGNLASAPLSPTDGDMYYNTATEKHYAYQNGTWILLSPVYDAAFSTESIVDLNNGNVQSLLITGASTKISFTGGVIGVPITLYLNFDQNGGQNIVWSPLVRWSSEIPNVTTALDNYRFSKASYEIIPVANGEYVGTQILDAVPGVLYRGVTNIGTAKTTIVGLSAGAFQFAPGMWTVWGISGAQCAFGDDNRIYHGPSSSVPIGRSFSYVSISNQNCGGIESGTGNAYSWGTTTTGGLGDGLATSGQSSPVSVLGGRSFTSIVYGTLATYAIEGSTGTAWTWGNGTNGELGNGSNVNSSSPVSVLGGRSWSKIDGLGIVVAIEASTGNAYCWGTATAEGTAAPQSSPVSVIGGRSFVDIAVGGVAAQPFAVAIEGSTGNAWAWGSGSNGKLGNNAIANASSPVSVLGGRSFTSISVGSTCAVAREGSTGIAWTWGANTNGQLGSTGDSTTTVSSPTSVLGGRSWSMVKASCTGGYAIEGSTGLVHAWGGVSSLGWFTFPDPQNFGVAHSPMPIRPAYIGNRLWRIGGNVIGIGDITGAIETSTGNIYCWGVAGPRIGDGTAAGSKSSPNSVQGGRSYSQITVGPEVVVAIESTTGNAYAWGVNTSGAVGDNTIANKSSPTSVIGGRSFSYVSAGVGLAGSVTPTIGAIEGNTGRIWTWGTHNNGAIGDNVVGAARSSPTSVVGARSFSKLNVGSNFMSAIEGSTGNAYCWGESANGQLGTNAAGNRSSPASVVGGRSFSQISGGETYAAAIEGSTGNAYCWGLGTTGQLGDGTVTTKSSPTSVVGGRSFVVISAGRAVTMAIEGSTGYLWGWGNSTNGATGQLRSVGVKSSPVSVAGARSYVTVVSRTNSLNGEIVLAQDSTGGLWFWGANSGGVYPQLLDYNFSPVSIPRFP